MPTKVDDSIQMPPQWIQRWVPPPDIKDHDGESLPSSAVFFGSPPQDIGTVLSAHSSATLDTITEFQNRGRASKFFNSFSRVRHQCTFVGEQGIARLELLPDGRCFDIFQVRFADADTLWAYETKRYVDSRYQGTAAQFVWATHKHSREGAVLFAINGNYYGENEIPASAKNLFFGRAAERIWSTTYLAPCLAAIRNSAPVDFPLRETGASSRRGFIRITAEYIDINLPGLFTSSRRHDLKTIWRVDVQLGSVMLRQSSDTKPLLTISYRELGNAQAFVSLIRYLIKQSSTNAATTVTI